MMTRRRERRSPDRRFIDLRQRHRGVGIWRLQKRRVTGENGGRRVHRGLPQGGGTDEHCGGKRTRAHHSNCYAAIKSDRMPRCNLLTVECEPWGSELASKLAQLPVNVGLTFPLPVEQLTGAVSGTSTRA
jgi:hypothetical protein